MAAKKKKRGKKPQNALSRSIYRVWECVTIPHRLYYALQALAEIQHVSYSKAFFNLLEEFRQSTCFEVFGVDRSRYNDRQFKMALELIGEASRTVNDYDPMVEGRHEYQNDNRGKHTLKVVAEHGQFVRNVIEFSRETDCPLNKSEVYKYFLIVLEKRIEKWIYSHLLDAKTVKDVNSWTNVERVRTILAQRHYSLDREDDKWLAIPLDSTKREDRKYWGQSSRGRLEAIADAQRIEKQLQEKGTVDRFRRRKPIVA